MKQIVICIYEHDTVNPTLMHNYNALLKTLKIHHYLETTEKTKGLGSNQQELHHKREH